MTASESWLNDAEWRILHQAVRPPTQSIDDFRSSCLSGRLGIYKRSDMDKVIAQLKEVLKHRGFLMAVSSCNAEKLKTKEDVARHVQKLLRTIPVAESTASTVTRPPIPTHPEPAVAATTTSSVPPPATPVIARTASDDHTPTSSMPPLAGSSRSLTGGACHRAMPATTTMPGRHVGALAGGDTFLHMSSGSDHHPNHHPGGVLGNPTGAYYRHESPLLRIETRIKRTTVRYSAGVPIRIDFELPLDCVESITRRTRKVCLIPTEPSGSGVAPWNWPAVKNMSLTINGTLLTTPFRREWPLSKSKDCTSIQFRSYLFVDVTPLIRVGDRMQRVEIDITDKDYSSSLIIAVAQPRTAEQLRAPFYGYATHRYLGLGMYASPSASAAAPVVRLAHLPTSMRRLYEEALRGCTMDMDGGSRNADEDADVASTGAMMVPAACCISRGRIQTPVRGRGCDHLQCYDFAALMQTCHAYSHWNCPIAGCNQRVQLDELEVDPLLDAALRQLPSSCDVTTTFLILKCDAPSPGEATSSMSPHWEMQVKQRRRADVTAVDLDSDDDPVPAQRHSGSSAVGGDVTASESDLTDLESPPAPPAMSRKRSRDDSIPANSTGFSGQTPSPSLLAVRTGRFSLVPGAGAGSYQRSPPCSPATPDPMATPRIVSSHRASNGYPPRIREVIEL